MDFKPAINEDQSKTWTTPQQKISSCSNSSGEVASLGATAAAGGGGGAAPVPCQNITFANFNQDVTSLVIGTPSGYKIFSLNSCDSLDPIYENEDNEVILCERLFSSSLVATVTRMAPRKLRVCHFKKGSEICNYSYSTKILAVKMNRSRLVVCLEESLYVHNIRDMKVLHTIKDTPPNSAGLCALSPNSDHCYLAYPGHSTVGELQVFDAANLSSRSMIPAHDTQLAAVAFSPNGLRVATCSVKGTVIRVFSVTDGARLLELRRGLKRTVNIYSLSFSPCGTFLASSSNTETVHVFKLTEEGGIGSNSVGTTAGSVGDSGVSSGSDGSYGQSPPDSWSSYFSSMMSISKAYLPSQVADTLLQGRAFATVHHNQPGMKNVCALALIKRTLRLLVSSEDGFLYMYGINFEDGGDCSLIKQFNLISGDGQPIEPMINNNSPRGQDGVDEGVGGVDEKAGKLTKSGSYAEKVKNREPGELTAESEKFHEMNLATETPPKECFLLDDDGEFPPMMAS